MSSLFSSLPEHVSSVQILKKALLFSHLHHAYLLEGKDEKLLLDTALAVAQTLVCSEREASQFACGKCNACTRVLLREGEKVPRHPDVILLAKGLYEPSQIGRKSPETQDLSVEQIRSFVLRHQGYGPHEGKARVYILKNAEELSISSANALLKTLEEPGPNTYFFLLTRNREWLLPTIKSRTLTLRFGGLHDSHVKPSFSDEAHEISEALVQFVNAHLLGLTKEKPSKLSNLLSLSELAKKEKDHLQEALYAFSFALHEKALNHLSESPQMALELSLFGRHVEEALWHLDRNVGAPLVMEELLAKCNKKADFRLGT